MTYRAILFLIVVVVWFFGGLLWELVTPYDYMVWNGIMAAIFGSIVIGVLKSKKFDNWLNTPLKKEKDNDNN